MRVRTIEQELEAIDRFEIAAKENIATLEQKARGYITSAWIFVAGGTASLLFPIISNACGYGYGNLNLLGDYAGGMVASSWTLAGVFFIYVAFLGQKIQLEQQQIEIRHAKGQTVITRLELAEQRFENTFFSLLQFQNEILNLMDFKIKGKEVSRGRDVFRTYYRQLRERCLLMKRELYITRKGLDPYVTIERGDYKNEKLSFENIILA